MPSAGVHMFPLQEQFVKTFLLPKIWLSSSVRLKHTAWYIMLRETLHFPLPVSEMGHCDEK